MGMYINVGNAGFQSAKNGDYVDKSGLVGVVNATLFSERRFSCVTRSRRFGKSMAASSNKFFFIQFAKCKDKKSGRYSVAFPVFCLEVKGQAHAVHGRTYR